MKILFDATVMELRATGIAKASMFLYKNCLELMPSLRVTAIHRRRLNSSPPAIFQTRQIGSFLPQLIWRSTMISLMARREKAQVIHFPWSGHVPVLPDNVTVATTLHDVLPLIIPKFFRNDAEESNYRSRIRRDIERTHLLMTDSEYSRQEILSQFQPHREPVVIPLAPTIVNNSPVSPPPGKTSASYFLYVGGYDPRKGLEPLLTVFQELYRQKKISSTLILTGEQHYYSEQLRTLIEQGRQLGAVEERGYVSDVELASLLTNAKALVYPSKYEGFGLPPLEAMSLGCPVITTRYTSLSEVCGDAACFIEPDNSVEFARALVALEENEELRADFSEKGKRQAARFSWKISAKKYIAALESTLRWSKEQG